MEAAAGERMEREEVGLSADALGAFPNFSCHALGWAGSLVYKVGEGRGKKVHSVSLLACLGALIGDELEGGTA